MTITLAQADAIVAGALAHGAAEGLKPLSVVVLDAGGHLKAFARQDGASNRRFDIAHGKAHGAISMGVSSRTLETMALERPHFMAGAIAAIGALVPVAGGVLVVDGAGAVVGAVGISGDTSDHDEAAALAGISAAGLDARP